MEQRTDDESISDDNEKLGIQRSLVPECEPKLSLGACNDLTDE